MIAPVEVGESGRSAAQFLDSLSNLNAGTAGSFDYLEVVCLEGEERDSYHWRSSTLKIQFIFRHIDFIRLILNLVAHD